MRLDMLRLNRRRLRQQRGGFDAIQFPQSLDPFRIKSRCLWIVG